jgi:hypothetical protein
MSPGIAVHFLRFVIAMKYEAHALRARAGVCVIARAKRAFVRGTPPENRNHKL